MTKLEEKALCEILRRLQDLDLHPIYSESNKKLDNINAKETGPLPAYWKKSVSDQILDEISIVRNEITEIKNWVSTLIISKD